MSSNQLKPQILPSSSTQSKKTSNESDCQPSYSLSQSSTCANLKDKPIVLSSNVAESEELLFKTSQKSVCFHSILSSEHEEKKVANPLNCLQIMINGSTLIKVKANTRHYRRFFSLTKDLSEIRWFPSSKKSSKAKYNIKDIKEVRPGKCIEIFRNKESCRIYLENISFFIIYGNKFEHLDFITSSPEESNIWITGLNYLIRANNCSGQKMRETWLLKVFDEADSEKKGFLEEWETIALMKKLNSQLCVRTLKKKFMEYNHGKESKDKKKISKHHFVTLFNETATRPDLYFILVRYCGRDYISVEDLQLFLESEQNVLGCNLKDCEELINRFELSEEAKKSKQLLIDGFTQMLMSKMFDVFNSSHETVCQDMTQPLSHYFISTFHNTNYFFENQLKESFSKNWYSKALLQGARCIKIECWNSSKGPIVFHNNTITISLEEVLEVINEYAFITTDYPLIIQLENHCNIECQKMISHLLTSIFKKNLFIPNQFDSHDRDQSICFVHNSLEKLKRKILIIGKKLPDNCNEEKISVDFDTNQMASKKNFICKELSNLFALSQNSCCNLLSLDHNSIHNKVCYLNESFASKMAITSTRDFINHNKSFLTQTQFLNTRQIDSSNINLLEFWNCGCQLVSINFQSSKKLMDIYHSWFKKNGSCGYVLKPDFLRDHYFYLNLKQKDLISHIDPLNIRLKIISGQHLPMPKGSSSKTIFMDPYVTVQVLGVPIDCAECRTKTVSNELNSPQFNEIFEFNIKIPELALIRFTVLDDEYILDDFIGQYTAPVDCIQPGYRHIPLFAQNGEVIENASLFVHISFTYRCTSKARRRKKKFWNSRFHALIKQTGFKQIDEIFKNVLSLINQSFQYKRNFEKLMIDLCDECNLQENANLVQCLRVLILRLASCLDVSSFSIIENNDGNLSFKIIGEMGQKLSKSIASLEKTVSEIKDISQTTSCIVESIKKYYNSILVTAEKQTAFNSIIEQIKRRKVNKVAECFIWNLSYIRVQMKNLKLLQNDAECALKQVVRSKEALQNLFLKERELLSSCKSEITELFKTSNFEMKPVVSEPSPSSDGRLRVILKKSVPDNNMSLNNQHNQDKSKLNIFH